MSTIFKIISFTKIFRKWYLFMGLFVVVISLLSLVTPLLSKQVVDLIVKQLQGQPQPLSQFGRLLGLIIATDLAITSLTAVSQWVGDILAVRLQTYLSKTFYAHLLHLDVGFYDNHITGQLVNKLYRGIQSITDFIQNMLNNFLPFFLTAFVTILILGHYSLLIAFLLAILFPIYILISHGSSLAWRKFEDAKNGINDLSQGRAYESISAIRLVKSFAAEAHELSTFVDSRHQIEHLAIRQTRGWHLFDFYRRLTLNVILFAIYSYIVYWTFHARYTLGEMTLLLQLVNQARFPLFAMSFILGQIQQASAGSKDFFQLIHTPARILDTPGSLPLDASVPTIKFHQVSFSYDSAKPVLSNISFSLGAHEKLALVGESGQGKSTLVNLLLRYYIPDSGQIFVGNQDISGVTLKSLRQNIAVVFQESLLFSGSILENIRYGHPHAALDEVIQVARAANAHEFIKDLPSGYDSLVGERGVKLSGGQKQRISIARAMLKNAPIILLDEATSSLDSKSEMLVQQGLDHLLKNRTSIIIAHRLTTIASADHVLVLSHGTVAEYGTPKQLLGNKKSLYSKLVALDQSRLKEFELVG